MHKNVPNISFIMILQPHPSVRPDIWYKFIVFESCIEIAINNGIFFQGTDICANSGLLDARGKNNVCFFARTHSQDKRCSHAYYDVLRTFSF